MHEMIRKQPGYGLSLNNPGICFRRVIATQEHCAPHNFSLIPTGLYDSWYFGNGWHFINKAAVHFAQGIFFGGWKCIMCAEPKSGPLNLPAKVWKNLSPSLYIFKVLGYTAVIFMCTSHSLNYRRVYVVVFVHSLWELVFFSRIKPHLCKS